MKILKRIVATLGNPKVFFLLEITQAAEVIGENFHGPKIVGD
jgi:hypothetical protein